jgi:Pyruvate/2-oxoacid:ferredoxin oxidoreductase delta subunit
MSSGHKRGGEDYAPRSKAEFAKLRSQGDTDDFLAQPYTINTSLDIPDVGGISLDRKTVYIDRTFAQWLRSGKVTVPNMTAENIIQAIAEHEHAEESISQADNASDMYPTSHAFAVRAEHNFVEKLTSPEVYEKRIAPALKKIERKRIQSAPKDLWVAPYIDDPDESDKRDAFKVSKKSVNYGMGEQKCEDCAMFCPGSGILRECKKVSGMVRKDRWCELWSAKDAD